MALSELKNEFAIKKYEIGEAFYFSDIYTLLNRVEGVLDTVSVKVNVINSAGYSQILYDIDANTSADGRYISVPEDYILEVKNLNIDIKGSIT